MGLAFVRSETGDGEVRTGETRCAGHCGRMLPSSRMAHSVGVIISCLGSLAVDHTHKLGLHSPGGLPHGAVYGAALWGKERPVRWAASIGCEYCVWWIVEHSPDWEDGGGGTARQQAWTSPRRGQGQGSQGQGPPPPATSAFHVLRCYRRPPPLWVVASFFPGQVRMTWPTGGPLPAFIHTWWLRTWPGNEWVLV